MDTHYTPSSVANSLVEAAHDLRPSLIADLAAGNGDLLLAAERVWPTATFVATDIDCDAIRGLTRLRPSWIVACCDLRSRQSRESCLPLKSILKSVSLLLLNPPFSCRGGTRFPVQTPNGPLFASTAISFLLQATEYVADTGHIACVLPLGSFHNQKDVEAWNCLESRYNVRILHECAGGTFPGSAAKTVLARLSPILKPTDAQTSTTTTLRKKSHLRVQVIRGCCPIHKLRQEKAKPILVHYTDIQDGIVKLNGRRGFGEHRCVTGPAILIPRVGSITVEKIALLQTSLPVMLSDCVIALKPDNDEHLAVIRDKIIANYPYFTSKYTGTGAPFITIARLNSFLESIGVDRAKQS